MTGKRVETTCFCNVVRPPPVADTRNPRWSILLSHRSVVDTLSYGCSRITGPVVLGWLGLALLARVVSFFLISREGGVGEFHPQRNNASSTMSSFELFRSAAESALLLLLLLYLWINHEEGLSILKFHKRNARRLYLCGAVVI